MTISRKFSHVTFSQVIYLLILFFFPSVCYAQLHGTYTINPDGGPFPNFTTIKAAFDSLASQGVDSAVVFNIADGNYYSSTIIFGTPAGASAVNTITFQGNESDSTKVRLYNLNQLQGSSHMLLPMNAQHFIFRKIKFEVNGAAYARVLVTYSSMVANTSLVFENCLFMGNATGTGPNFALCCIQQADGPIKKLVFRNNLFVNGSYGIYCENGLDLSVFTITGNEFLDQNTSAIYIYNSNNVSINDNDIHLNNTSATGIELNECDITFQCEETIFMLPRERGMGGLTRTQDLSWEDVMEMEHCPGESSPTI